MKDDQISHLVLYYKGHYYDTKDIGFDNIISYLEIIIENKDKGDEELNIFVFFYSL